MINANNPYLEGAKISFSKMDFNPVHERFTVSMVSLAKSLRLTYPTIFDGCYICNMNAEREESRKLLREMFGKGLSYSAIMEIYFGTPPAASSLGVCKEVDPSYRENTLLPSKFSGLNPGVYFNFVNYPFRDFRYYPARQVRREATVQTYIDNVYGKASPNRAERRKGR